MYQKKKVFLNFYFLKVYISLSMDDLHLKLYICIGNITVEGTVSHICDIGPDEGDTRPDLSKVGNRVSLQMVVASTGKSSVRRPSAAS